MLNDLQSRLKAFMRIVREFRHTKINKRCGRGNVENGIFTTRDGELVIVCPACPLPDINLPHDWDSAPDDFKYAYPTTCESIFQDLSVIFTDSCIS